MQTALLRGKQAGVTELDGLGRFTWTEIVALIDVLVGMVWISQFLEPHKISEPLGGHLNIGETLFPLLRKVDGRTIMTPEGGASLLEFLGGLRQYSRA